MKVKDRSRRWESVLCRMFFALAMVQHSTALLIGTPGKGVYLEVMYTKFLIIQTRFCKYTPYCITAKSFLVKAKSAERLPMTMMLCCLVSYRYNAPESTMTNSKHLDSKVKSCIMSTSDDDARFNDSTVQCVDWGGTKTHPIPCLPGTAQLTSPQGVFCAA